MEKITYLPNGQWLLNKSDDWDDFDAESSANDQLLHQEFYNHTNHGKHNFSPQQLKENQQHVLDFVKKNKINTKMVGGVPHILMHRGIYDNPDLDEYINLKYDGPNRHTWSDDMKTISTKFNHINTFSKDVASQYGSGAEMSMYGNADEDRGMSYSFWVPIDKILTTQAKFTGDDLDLSDHGGTQAVLVAPGDYEVHEYNQTGDWDTWTDED